MVGFSVRVLAVSLPYDIQEARLDGLVLPSTLKCVTVTVTHNLCARTNVSSLILLIIPVLVAP